MKKLQGRLSFDHFAEHGVLAVQPRAGHKSNEELRAIGVGTGIRHRQQEWFGMLEQEIFIVKLGSIDGFASSAVVVGEISSLGHEVIDDAMEVRSLVSEALFVGAESSEVGRSFGHFLVEELKDQLAGLASPKIDVEEDVLEHAHPRKQYDPNQIQYHISH